MGSQNGFDNHSHINTMTTQSCTWCEMDSAHPQYDESGIFFALTNSTQGVDRYPAIPRIQSAGSTSLPSVGQGPATARYPRLAGGLHTPAIWPEGVYIYIYMYIYLDIHACIYIYIYQLSYVLVPWGLLLGEWLRV